MTELMGGHEGLRKAAVLLLQMGKDGSAKVLSKLREAEVEALSAEVARLGAVESNYTTAVLDEFHAMAKARKHVSHGGMDYARELLIETLGHDRADEIVDRIGATMLDVPFRFLQRAEPRQVLSFLQEEHPQTVALVLAHMPANLASAVLGGLVPDRQSEIALRVATMGRTSPEIVRKLENLLERKLSSLLQPSDVSTIGGVGPLVDIINRSDRATERSILDGLAKRSPELADEIRSQMFMFEDLVGIDDKSLQLVLRNVSGADLATALKGVRDDVRDKITRNLSERASENLIEEIEVLGAVRLRVVEEAQAKIISEIRSLEESGQIVLRRGDDDEFVA
ncbi:flagellar motor switch protein FliG [Actinokineospora auranticolor]|uniref:Flagellar motor switch protein FliG n=1 Tax=Actinokineospora auranticolor TaxID=155976 RepID=A0A2S6GML8_9PSEU|nr:flagellar motor switch protein FliG [Actinokineospora auranticolor]PPK66478.1 flagellar motor switch protein FliG [Actinokineospora auranticolor]